jgi:acetyltransferase-like isoleucine patch superfamily enzyme
MSVVEKDMSEYSFMRILKRFYWDVVDPDERKYLLYYFISQFPGPAGNLMRGRFVEKKARSVGRNLIVMAGTRFRSIENLVLGNDVQIGYDNFIQAYGGVTIGDNVMTAPGVKIWSVNHNFEDKNVLIANQGVKEAEVIIGNDVWISSNAFILPGVVLPDGVVVSAGSVVGIKAYSPYSIVAGNPARVIGSRR